MSNAYFKVPLPVNEPVKTYKPGSPEKADLKAKLKELSSKQIEVPLIIGGKEIKTGKTAEMVIPHDHTHVLGVYHKAGEKEVNMAIEAALEARKSWAEMPWEHRVAIFQKAADLLAGPWRSTINAATMLGQSKVAHQAEIDSACELIDFWRFNTHYMAQIMGDQPNSAPGMWNRVEYRALEGFVFAVTPFNFTSIAGNLPTAHINPPLSGQDIDGTNLVHKARTTPADIPDHTSLPRPPHMGFLFVDSLPKNNGGPRFLPTTRNNNQAMSSSNQHQGEHYQYWFAPRNLHTGLSG